MKDENRDLIPPALPLHGEGLVDFDNIDTKLDELLKEAYPPIEAPLDLSEKILQGVPLSRASERIPPVFSGWLSLAAAAASIAIAFVLWNQNDSSSLNSEDITMLNAIVAYEQLDLGIPREEIIDEMFFSEAVLVDLGSVVGDLERVLNLVEQDIGEVR